MNDGSLVVNVFASYTQNLGLILEMAPLCDTKYMFYQTSTTLI